MAVGNGVFIMQQVLLLLQLAALIMSCSWPICAASRYGVTLRKSKSSATSRKGSKAKIRKTGPVRFVGLGTGESSLVIIAIVVAVIGILVVVYWCWRRHSARKYIWGTEKLAAKYSVRARDIGEPELRLFTHAEMKRATDHFASERVLGHGRFGDVYKGVLDDDTQVAIKSVKTSSIKGKDQVLNEVQLLSKVNHAHLIRLLGFCVRWKRLLLVYEYAINGSLSDQLVQKVDGSGAALDWKTRLQIASQSAQALAHLHSDGPICHGDVKANNILLDQSMNAKVSDYGLLRFGGLQDHKQASKCVQMSSGWPWISFKGHQSTPHSSKQAARVVTAGYLDQRNIDTEVADETDVYNFGVVLLELVTSRHEFASVEEDDEATLVAMVQRKKEQGKLEEVVDVELVRGAPEEERVQSMRSVVDLALECLDANGLNRPLMMKEVADRVDKIMSRTLHI